MIYESSHLIYFIVLGITVVSEYTMSSIVGFSGYYITTLVAGVCYKVKG